MALKNVVIGYAKGDKGDKGDTGERGTTGQTGPQGEPGNIADAAITDTQGLDVAKGAKTTAQKLFDAIADRIVNKLVTNDTLTTKLADYLLKSAMSSTNIDSTTNVPTSALVYSLMQDVNNNLSNGSVKSYFSPHKNNEADLCKGYNNSDGVFYFNYQGALVPIKKYVFSDGQGNGIFSSDQLVKNSDLPKNFKFLNLKYNTASSYDTEVLKYIESLKESVFIIYCQHGSASMYMGFIVGDGKYGTVLRFEYDSLYVNGCSGNAWAGWTKLG